MTNTRKLNKKRKTTKSTKMVKKVPIFIPGTKTIKKRHKKQKPTKNGQKTKTTTKNVDKRSNLFQIKMRNSK